MVNDSVTEARQLDADLIGRGRVVLVMLAARMVADGRQDPGQPGRGPAEDTSVTVAAEWLGPADGQPVPTAPPAAFVTHGTAAEGNTGLVALTFTDYLSRPWLPQSAGWQDHPLRDKRALPDPVPGDRQISWPKLRSLLGVSRMSMPDATTAKEVTGYERGTITPFGSTTRWPVVADERLADAAPVGLAVDEKLGVIAFQLAVHVGHHFVDEAAVFAMQSHGGEHPGGRDPDDRVGDQVDVGHVRRTQIYAVGIGTALGVIQAGDGEP